MLPKLPASIFSGLIKTTMLTMLVTVPGIFRLEAQPRQTLHDSINVLLAGWNNKQAPAISVAVVKDGHLLFITHAGMANIKTGRQNDSTTNFWIASVSKQFTAAAIYLLAGQKKMRIEESVRNYLPGLPGYFDKITIDHLIHHTSGIRDGFVLTALSKKPPSEYTNENVIQRISASRSLNSATGTTFEYNNSGYVLLASVIEKVTGQSYPEYMKENIFRPLGMNDTYVSGSFPSGDRLAEGYEEKGPGNYQENHFPGNTYGSTGIVTTIGDMVRWSRFLQKPTVVPTLKAIAIPLLQTGKLKNGKSISYAGGLEKFVYRGRPVYEHFGADEGFKADILYFPKTKVTVIGLTNNGSYFGLARLLYNISDFVHNGKTIASPGVNEPGDLIEETIYYNSDVPRLARVQKFPGFARISNSPFSYAAPYVESGRELHSLDPIPSRYLLKGDMLEYLDDYYRNAVSFYKQQPVSRDDDLKNFAGEYYSDELQASYNIILNGNRLQFEFVPGMTFDLYRVTGNDFMFDFVGDNYLQFNKDGFAFSREGCRRLVFKKRE